MGLCVFSGQMMQVWYQPIDQIQTNCTYENTGNGYHNTQFSAVFQRRKDQSQNGSCQHHAGGKSQYNVTELVGDLLERKADQCTCNGGTANSDGGQKYQFHKHLLNAGHYTICLGKIQCF